MLLLTSAATSYCGVIPGLENRATAGVNFPAHAVLARLQQDVLPAIREIWMRPSFQKLALHPLVNLLPNSSSTERQLIGELQDVVRSEADKAVLFVRLNERTVDSRLANRKSGRLPVSAAAAIRNLEGIRESCDDEWAFADDYFGPTRNTFAKEGDEELQRGEFIDAFSDELTYVGNSAARCLLVRAKTAVDALEDALTQLNMILLGSDLSLPRTLLAGQFTARKILAQLRYASLESPLAMQVEAAISLVQVAVTFAPDLQDLSWLPVPMPTISHHRHTIPFVLRSSRPTNTAHRIGHALVKV
jgi:hypothetical protein